MCLGVPGLVVALEVPDGSLASAVVEFGGLKRRVCVACVPEVQPGEYVIVHAGVAINRLDSDEANRLLDHLRAMDDLEAADRSAEMGP